MALFRKRMLRTTSGKMQHGGGRHSEFSLKSYLRNGFMYEFEILRASLNDHAL